ncbi:serine/threonine kinase [Fragilaria crotonensis]|nr:serine/threonine kinase [Fragilaria crotonensis]
MPLRAIDNDLIQNAIHGNLDQVRAQLLAGANVNAQDDEGFTALMLAIRGGHEKVVNALLQHKNVDVNAKTTRGHTTLMLASANGHEKVVNALLKHKNVDVNAKTTNSGESALMSASLRGLEKVVHELLQNKNVDVNAQKNDGTTSLMGASFEGHEKVVHELLQHKNVDVNAQTNEGLSALMGASLKGHEKVVNTLLQHKNVDVNAQTNEGLSALMCASLKGHLEIVRALLHKNADVNAQCMDGTALIIACRFLQEEVVRELLQHDKVDVNAKCCNDGATALMKACHLGDVDIVLELLKHSADVTVRDDDGKTALFIASQFGRNKVVAELLKHNDVDVNVQHYDGTTALYVASKKGHVQVVRELLQHNNVDVNVQHNDGTTALYVASQNGHLEDVRELLQHNNVDHKNVDVNVQHHDGTTALYIASQNGHLEVVCELLKKNADVNVKCNTGATALEAAIKFERGEIVRYLVERQIIQDRTTLYNVMSTASADPVELSSHYMKQCTVLRELGSGAFGKVSLVEDKQLQKQFAVKKFNILQLDEDAIEGIRRSFQREISALKRFRHPNIIVLYAYNLKTDSDQQYLLYEYAANGSLDGFLKDDGCRARLPAYRRLSIMYELVRAVHFLHTGGCGNFNVYHRDIKSANICLDDAFTARLIDCGLAKFVPTGKRISPSVSSLSVMTSFGSAGTLGYMCPRYASGKCAYEASCDVYSIGVVMVELVLGRLNGGLSTGKGKEFRDVFEVYVEDEDGERIDSGWENLVSDADPNIIWNPDSLKLVCQTAIHCMDRTPRKRLETSALLRRLSNAIHLNENIQNRLVDDDFGASLPCTLCHVNMTGTNCPKGTHYLCKICIENKVTHYYNDGCDEWCTTDGCSNEPFRDEVLQQLLPGSIYTRYVDERAVRRIGKGFSEQLDALKNGMHDVKGGMHDITDGLRGVKVGVDEGNDLLKKQHSQFVGLRCDVRAIRLGVDATNESLQKQQEMLQRLAGGLDRTLGALALLAPNQFEECPNLVWVTPTSVESSNDPRNWIRNATMRTYQVVFICAHSRQLGHKTL